jgi:hypothetical protein
MDTEREEELKIAECEAYERRMLARIAQYTCDDGNHRYSTVYMHTCAVLLRIIRHRLAYECVALCHTAYTLHTRVLAHAYIQCYLYY